MYIEFILQDFIITHNLLTCFSGLLLQGIPEYIVNLRNFRMNFIATGAVSKKNFKSKQKL